MHIHSFKWYIKHDNKIHIEVQKIIKLIVKVFLKRNYRCRKVGSIGIDREAVSVEVEKCSLLNYYILDTWVWIGGEYTSAIQWITGEADVYRNWMSGYPNTGCVELEGGNSFPQAQWATGSCNHDHRYMCEKEHA